MKVAGHLPHRINTRLKTNKQQKKPPLYDKPYAKHLTQAISLLVMNLIPLLQPYFKDGKLRFKEAKQPDPQATSW